ncbi:MAG TPA: SDR family oxidoreductase [Gemmatimonadaceae bacterium]|nr:SDR family oxidoreductase [Gemmatimonadaceae bacterium]
MQLGLEGKVALVAAASKGLGRACAEELAREGAKVVICARGKDALMATRDAIVEATGADVHAVAADLSSMTDIERVTQQAFERFSRVDIVVNNAGGPPSGPFEKHPWSAWDDAVKLTLRSAVELTRIVLPGMRERRWGRVINITSIAVKQPVDGLMLSNSLRAAVTGWARTLANEVARDGVTVNNVLPGFTRTDRVETLNAATAAREGVSVEEIQKRTEAQIPMRRLGEPPEFGAIVAFLASERASYITAQSIAIDGGWISGLL